MVRKKQYNLSADKSTGKSGKNEKFSRLDSLAEVCLIYKSTKDTSVQTDDRSKAGHLFSERIPREKINNSWRNSIGAQEPNSSTFVGNGYGENNADAKANGPPSLFLSVRTEIKKGKNVNMDYMRSDRLWTICLRLDGAQSLKQLGFEELRAQGKIVAHIVVHYFSPGALRIFFLLLSFFLTFFLLLLLF